MVTINDVGDDRLKWRWEWWYDDDYIEIDNLWAPPSHADSGGGVWSAKVENWLETKMNPR